jgi:hypothetical protein
MNVEFNLSTADAGHYFETGAGFGLVAFPLAANISKREALRSKAGEACHSPRTTSRRSGYLFFEESTLARGS